ncbi:hypothetical protein Ct9H90mP29_08580 [bacterium]|nr:MAG: hypothetical protein Ct9H90mP29_08580 [bacterium]
MVLILLEADLKTVLMLPFKKDLRKVIMANNISWSRHLYRKYHLAPINGIKLVGSGEENCIIDGDSTGRVVSFIDSLNGIIDTNT